MTPKLHGTKNKKQPNLKLNNKIWHENIENAIRIFQDAYKSISKEHIHRALDYKIDSKR